MDSVFNIKRFYLLMAKDIRLNTKSCILGVTAYLSFIFILMFLDAKAGNIDTQGYNSSFSFGLFLIGTIFTSSCFKEAHLKYHNHDFLMLPASVFEKFFEKLIFTSLLFAVFFFTVFALFANASALIFDNFFDMHIIFFNPFSADVFKTILNYFIIHSVFFLGASWFRSRNYIKTGLTISALIIFMIFLFFLMIYLFLNRIYPEMANQDFSFYYHFHNSFIVKNFEFLGENFVRFVKFSYYFLLPVLCWIISYLKIRNIQEKDGINAGSVL